MEKVAGIILLVENIEASVSFYKHLGFEVVKEVPAVATTVGLNGFWVELLNKQEVVSEEYKEDLKVAKHGAGTYLQIQVRDIDAFYSTLASKGIVTAVKPKNYPWGHREFVVTDPGGYKIAFFTPID